MTPRDLVDPLIVDYVRHSINIGRSPCLVHLFSLVYHAWLLEMMLVNNRQSALVHYDTSQ
jgi:hypothetical protein